MNNVVPFSTRVFLLKRVNIFLRSSSDLYLEVLFFPPLTYSLMINFRSFGTVDVISLLEYLIPCEPAEVEFLLCFFFP